MTANINNLISISTITEVSNNVALILRPEKCVIRHFLVERYVSSSLAFIFRNPTIVCSIFETFVYYCSLIDGHIFCKCDREFCDATLPLGNIDTAEARVIIEEMEEIVIVIMCRNGIGTTFFYEEILEEIIISGPPIDPRPYCDMLYDNTGVGAIQNNIMFGCGGIKGVLNALDSTTSSNIPGTTCVAGMAEKCSTVMSNVISSNNIDELTYNLSISGFFELCDFSNSSPNDAIAYSCIEIFDKILFNGSIDIQNIDNVVTNLLGFINNSTNISTGARRLQTASNYFLLQSANTELDQQFTDLSASISAVITTDGATTTSMPNATSYNQETLANNEAAATISSNEITIKALNLFFFACFIIIFF